MRRWRPSASQRREFAIKMQDLIQKADYEEKKRVKAEKRRSTSEFNYESAGGFYVPTKYQHDMAFKFCMSNDFRLRDADNQVIYGFTCQEKIHHDYIHIINEQIRKITI